VRGDSRRLTASESTALAHTLREALTNARKHAPGAPVFVTVSWEPASVSVEVENALVGAVVAVPGGGHGIRGMRERFARIPGAGVTAGASGDRFVVLATVATEPS
jgi:signal transduction histidine kinase